MIIFLGLWIRARFERHKNFPHIRGHKRYFKIIYCVDWNERKHQKN